MPQEVDHTEAYTKRTSQVVVDVWWERNIHPDQPSEAWVFIWIIHNLPPDMCYTKAFVIPGAIVPGLNKPGDLDSFLFPSLYHIATLQHEGL